MLHFPSSSTLTTPFHQLAFPPDQTSSSTVPSKCFEPPAGNPICLTNSASWNTGSSHNLRGTRRLPQLASYYRDLPKILVQILIHKLGTPTLRHPAHDTGAAWISRGGPQPSPPTFIIPVEPTPSVQTSLKCSSIFKSGHKELRVHTLTSVQPTFHSD